MTNTDAKSMRRSWHDMLPEIRAENEAWRAEHLPRLRAEQAIKDARREAGRAALAAIEPEHRNAIIAAYGGPL